MQNIVNVISPMSCLETSQFFIGLYKPIDFNKNNNMSKALERYGQHLPHILSKTKRGKKIIVFSKKASKWEKLHQLQKKQSCQSGTIGSKKQNVPVLILYGVALKLRILMIVCFKMVFQSNYLSKTYLNLICNIYWYHLVMCFSLGCSSSFLPALRLVFSPHFLNQPQHHLTFSKNGCEVIMHCQNYTVVIVNVLCFVKAALLLSLAALPALCSRSIVA